MTPKFSDELLDELADVIDINRVMEDSQAAPVIFDGRQYTIKVPRRLADKAGMGSKNLFEFKVKTEIVQGKPVARLVGELLHDSAQE